MKTHVLVAANRTATSDELIAALAERAAKAPAAFELLVPPSTTGEEGRAAAQRTLDEALEHCRAAGLETTGRVGSDTDVVIAVLEAYDPRRHDEILVSTLPASSSHWLNCNAPARIARATDAIVHHVVSRERRPPRPATPVERRGSDGVLAPLMALGYGAGRRERAL